MPKVCRTCLKEIASTDFVSINDSTSNTSSNSRIVKQELAICMPELDLNLVINPVVCTTCVNDLHVAYDFKRRCLQTEEKIQTYVQSNSLEVTCVDLNHLMGHSTESQYQVNDQVTPIDVKEEPNTGQSELDVEFGNCGNTFFDENRMPEYCIKTEPICTNYSYSNDAPSCSEKNHEQIHHMNFSHADPLPLLTEFPTVGLHEKSEAISPRIDKMIPNEIPFKCLQCDFSTPQKKNLIRHIQSHTEPTMTTPTTSVTTLKRRTFTIENKVDLIRMLEGGTKISEVCRRTGLPTSTVCCIMKKKDEILEAFQKNGLNLKRLRKPTHADVDEALLAWCKQQQSVDASLTGPILKVKAEELARSIGNYDFVCTNGWLDRFKTRYNIGKKKC